MAALVWAFAEVLHTGQSPNVTSAFRNLVSMWEASRVLSEAVSPSEGLLSPLSICLESALGTVSHAHCSEDTAISWRATSWRHPGGLSISADSAEPLHLSSLKGPLASSSGCFLPSGDSMFPKLCGPGQPNLSLLRTLVFSAMKASLPSHSCRYKDHGEWTKHSNNPLSEPKVSLYHHATSGLYEFEMSPIVSSI